MKKILIILVLVCCANNNYAQKTIAFKDTLIGIRKVQNDTTIHQQFKFKNNGKLPLSIKNWKPLNEGIECKYSKGKIKPNDSGFVYFIFSIQKYSISFSKKIELTFSNGKKQQLEIIFCAENEFVIGDAIFDFDTISDEQSVYHSYIFRNISNDTLYIVGCYTSWGKGGCSYSREPILPFQYFKVTQGFNPAGSYGIRHTIIPLRITNKIIQFDIQLQIRGFVTPYIKTDIAPEPIRKK